MLPLDASSSRLAGQLAPAEGVAQNGARGAVLHAAARVEPLGLEPEPTGRRPGRSPAGSSGVFPTACQSAGSRAIARCRTAVIACSPKAKNPTGRVGSITRARPRASSPTRSRPTPGPAVSCFIRSAREMLASSSSTRCWRACQTGRMLQVESGATSLGVHRVGVAVDLEGLMLGRGHDVPHRDGGGLLGQEVAALGAPHALHQAGPPEPQQDLLDVIGRKPLGCRPARGRPPGRCRTGRAWRGGWR